MEKFGHPNLYLKGKRCMYVTSDMAIYLVEMKKYQIGYFRLKRTVQFPYGRKKKKGKREKKNSRYFFPYANRWKNSFIDLFTSRI